MEKPNDPIIRFNDLHEEHSFNTFYTNDLMRTQFICKLKEENPNPLITIIHHTDMDGICAAQIAKEYLINVIGLIQEEIDYIPYNYEKNYDFNAKIDPKCLFIIFVDLSPKMEDFKNVLTNSDRYILWVDHHICSVREVQNSREYAEWDFIESRLDAYVNIDGCGTKNVYDITKNYPIPSSPVNMKFGDIFNESAIFLVDTYDRWLQTTYKPSADALNRLFYASEQLFVGSEIVETVLHKYGDQDLADSTLREYIMTGIRFQEIEKRRNDLRYDKFHKDYILTTSDGKEYKVCVVWGSGNSQVFGSHIDEYDVVILVRKTKANEWNYSFYSSKDNIDCSHIAEQFGGGGHKSAAGCSTKYNIITSKYCKLL